MSQSTIAAPQSAESRTETRAPTPPVSASVLAPGLRTRVFAQLTRMLAQLALIR